MIHVVYGKYLDTLTRNILLQSNNILAKFKKKTIFELSLDNEIFPFRKKVKVSAKEFSIYQTLFIFSSNFVQENVHKYKSQRDKV